jgi:GDP-4-dehydro-6-deoxy-D-mannose reductase
MEVLITGITGFVGSHLADYFLENHPSIELHGVKRYHLSRMDNVNHIYDKINWYDCNLLEQSAVLKMIREIRPDIIFHMAAESFVSPSWAHPMTYMNANYGMTVNILEAVKDLKLNTKVHLPGSGEEYGDISEEMLPITTETILNPVNPYAVTKIAQDLIGFVYWKSYGVNVIRTRAFNHEGPRRHFVFGIPSFAYQIAKIEAGLQSPVIETGDVDDKRNFTDVRDMVAAYWHAVNHCLPGELYLVGQEDPSMVCTFKEALDRLLKISNLSAQNVEIKKVARYTRPTKVPFLISDISKFNSVVDWKAKFTLDDILKDTLDYWRKMVRDGKH